MDPRVKLADNIGNVVTILLFVGIAISTARQLRVIDAEDVANAKRRKYLKIAFWCSAIVAVGKTIGLLVL